MTPVPQSRTRLEMTGRLTVNSIRPSRTNPRTDFPAESLRAMAATFADWGGPIADILVRPRAADPSKIKFDGRKWTGVDYYELVSGERRWRAAKLAGIRELGVKVMVLTDAEVLEIQLLEIEHGERVKPQERAAGYSRLVEAIGVEATAKKFGKSAATVLEFLRFANVPPSAPPLAAATKPAVKQSAKRKAVRA